VQIPVSHHTAARTRRLAGPVIRRETSRLTAGQRRQHFIDAALRLFSTRGFRGTTTRAIAEAAGVSEALLFRHFATKQDLYAAILRTKAEQSGFKARLHTLRRHAKRTNDAALVQELVKATLDSYRRDPEFQRLMLYATLEGHELATASQQVFGRPTFAFLRAYVVERQAAGVLRAGDPGLLAVALVALPAYFALLDSVLGVKRASVLGVKRADASENDTVDLFTRLILDGVRMHADEPTIRG
jgi:TetR/AcrR family transcriptional regulator